MHTSALPTLISFRRRGRHGCITRPDIDSIPTGDREQKKIGEWIAAVVRTNKEEREGEEMGESKKERTCTRNTPNERRKLLIVRLLVSFPLQ